MSCSERAAITFVEVEVDEVAVNLVLVVAERNLFSILYRSFNSGNKFVPVLDVFYSAINSFLRVVLAEHFFDPVSGHFFLVRLVSV